jgi:pimeloyl-ACP methyl ester carboxylesterase
MGNTMQEKSGFTSSRLPLQVDDVQLDVSVIHRRGTLAPILFLHGFGSTKEDYADIVRWEEFSGRPFIAYDAPGCGETSCSDLAQVSIPFLLKTTLAVLDHFGLDRFHLVGHSMGGLTALLFAHQHPERVLSFVNIEGNVAPEDCFLSRQILQYPAQNTEQFFAELVERTRHAPAYGSALYASGLRCKVRAAAVSGIFRSMVDLSDTGDLMNKFVGLSCPNMFMYGDQNASLTYLAYIRAKGVRLVEIPDCAHFPMYSNAPKMWEEIAAFLASVHDGRREAGV